MAAKTCPQCSERNAPMGVLGRTTHYRCRACGWMYYSAPKARPPKQGVCHA